MKKYKNNIIAVTLSLVLTVFMWHRFLASGNSIIFVLIFMACYYFIKRVVENTNKRQCITAIILGILFRDNRSYMYKHKL